MFSPQVTTRVLDRFYADLDFGFHYDLGLNRLIWKPWFGGPQFVVELRRQSNTFVLAWGYQDSSLHDAICWGDEDPVDPTCQDCGGSHSPDQLPCPPMHIKATEDRLYQLILQEVRRVADFADSNHKRHVEFAELNAVFTSIVRGWEADLDEITDTELLHTSELPRGCSLKLEYPDRSSCRLLCDDKVLHVHRDGHGWRIDIESSGLQLISNTWRLTEEVVAEQATTNGVVPLSQLRQEVFQVLSGV